MAEIEQQLRSLTDQYGELQKEMSGHVQSRQKLESQQQENRGVQKEFSLLKDDANIYKLVGPVLLKQDKTEAVNNVNGRLGFIGDEIKKFEGLIKDIQEKSDELRTQIMQLQSEAQPEGNQQQQQIAA